MRIKRDESVLDACPREKTGNVLETLPFVSRRVRRVEPDQCPEQFDDVDTRDHLTSSTRHAGDDTRRGAGSRLPDLSKPETPRGVA
jgi:hypothetical protein